MDLLIVLTLASGLLVLLCLFFLLKQKKTKDTGNDEVEPQQRAQEGQRPRRAVAARNQRVRLRAGAQEQQNLDENEEEAAAKPAVEFSDKLGAKKRAKMEAKAERKAQREAEVHAREERKRRQELEAEERQKEEELAEKEREKREEEEQKVREEKERQEHEEYLKMKAMFSVEEEGFEEGGSDDSEGNLLQEFIAYIKKTKVVVLEDLAATFKLRTQHVIDRIQELQNEGTLTGVIDDRGKFIYISEAELAAVAKFVKQRGRVSISELAESSNKLINLNPNQPTVPVES